MFKEEVKVDREQFLHTMESVQPGVANREILQQSSCLVFLEGSVCSFNEDIACRASSGLPESYKGAVQAGPFIEILRKIPDATIGLRMTSKQLVISGKNRQTGITMEKEIMLPIDSVDTPNNWKTIHPDFKDAVGIVQECASKDQTAFVFTCIHIHPDYLEACDNLQLARYQIKSGVETPFLVRRDALRHVTSMDFTKMSVTPGWLHFKANKLVLSCKRYKEKFEDLSEFLKIKGIPTVLPKALGEAAERCEVFSKENSDNNMLSVSLTPGGIQVKGQGASGYHVEKKRLKYEGKPMKFCIGPTLLIELLKRHTDCEVNKKTNRLIVDGGKFRYLICLQKEDVTLKEDIDANAGKSKEGETDE